MNLPWRGNQLAGFLIGYQMRSNDGCQKGISELLVRENVIDVDQLEKAKKTSKEPVEI